MVHWQGVSDAAAQNLLDAGMAPHLHDTLDGAKLDALCEQLTQSLRAAGYLVAQVLVTSNDRERFRQSGELRLTVFEGKVGAISVRNSSRVSDERITAIATEALCPDGVGDQCVLRSSNMERAQLLLQDLPGVKLEPVEMGPKGVAVGQTAVGVVAEQSQPLVGGYVGLDNYGYPATGVGELTAGVTLTNLFHAGDVVQASGLVTNRHQGMGSLLGSMPIGYSGLRAQLGYNHTLYSVPEVGASGYADTVFGGVSYPLARGLDRNWVIGLDGISTISHQEVDGAQAFAPRWIAAGRVTLTGNAGDRPIALGQSYWSGSASWMFGHVSQDLGGAEDVTGQLGGFNKFNLNALGKLNLGNSNWYVLGNLRAQYATSNLDASQKLGLGGQSGVRAYRPDEGSLDSGMVLSVELRRVFTLPNGDRISAGPILDYANGVVNQHAYANWQTMMGYSEPSLSNHRELASWGIGVDYVSHSGYSASLTWSNRFPGSADSVNYPGSARNRFLASVSMKF
ncbi:MULTISPECIES: ShlB/FhaC/HecB family hemolysin secretion/activation protein [Burkholderia cepacia complex]|uniref:ShlB/FhaC/HecB family hemolysin secretion/activation protein n=1 Tax=Burkholderia cepacia complex TaxID=87882 RepID=UPI00157B5BE6|nr:ShlB/FhaC/HecB family hemolysin secretion/activation protein [Burkholderia pyrrocinia]NTY41080.1 ShlB/FhaC/HecB family hemolysin secretion/activation protein [Burkholderia diffusa]